MSDVQILNGDCREILPALPEKSVHCCVTSPPYFGLRDYGVEGQIGLEKTPRQFIREMVKVFREVRRVLRDDGTLWLNMGDSYSARFSGNNGYTDGRTNRSERRGPGIAGREKNILGMPWRVALALQADGWYLRQDIIWSKPNPMPESVRDRCTKSHEYIFLMSKKAKYFYDFEAIKEPASGTAHARRSYKTPDGWDTSKGEGGHGQFHKDGREKGKVPGCHPKSAPAGSGIKANESFSAAVVDLVNERNKRSVWTVATQAYSEAHFATFPEKLIEPCILAGCPEGGIVLDPFGGSGTTGRVAIKHRRKAILIELNEDYIPLQVKRLSSVQVRLF